MQFSGGPKIDMLYGRLDCPTEGEKAPDGVLPGAANILPRSPVLEDIDPEQLEVPCSTASCALLRGEWRFAGIVWVVHEDLMPGHLKSFTVFVCKS